VKGDAGTELQIPKAALELFRAALSAILSNFRDLKMDKVDIGYAGAIAARRHQRDFDRFLAEPFLAAVSRGAAECYEANRAWIEALDPDQQSSQRRELRRRWLVAVIKLTPPALEPFVRQAEFEESMNLRAREAIARSRKPPSVSAAAAGQPAATEESGAARSNPGNPISSAEPTSAPVPPDDTEERLRAALTLDDQASIEQALADLWGPGWSHNACAREAGVNHGTVRNMIRKNNLKKRTWTKIVEAFRKRRAQCELRL
jgi:hypothetical protein